MYNMCVCIYIYMYIHMYDFRKKGVKKNIVLGYTRERAYTAVEWSCTGWLMDRNNCYLRGIIGSKHVDIMGYTLSGRSMWIVHTFPQDQPHNERSEFTPLKPVNRGWEEVLGGKLSSHQQGQAIAWGDDLQLDLSDGSEKSMFFPHLPGEGC